ncbi:PucR family transcriptional regulator [Nocardia wallacei]|uniref:PucR family transcriptional regulator n=1 Tax=Nocardia wallacei TaxID=480035 RepID=UPI002456E961|nr:helix-turn-helix domain-containing protein [Nocardia wallacei]
MTETIRTAERPMLVSGRPVTSPLSDVRSLSRKMVGHFVDTVVACRTMPTDAVSGDFTSATRLCLELAVAMYEGTDVPEKIRRLEDAAAGWAREGIPLGTIHRAVHEGFRLGTDLVYAHATPADFESVKQTARRVLDVLETITVAISDAYVKEQRAAVAEHHHAVHTLTTALLSGHPTSTMARECGIDIADSYHVVALSIPPHPDEHNPKLDGDVVARRKLRRIQTALATRCGNGVLSLLSVDGGTVLIPTTTITDTDLDTLIDTLSTAALVHLTATVAHADPERIPQAAVEAHQLLDTVQRLHASPGLHRMDSLAAEYQITRPGPAREALGALLAPLDNYPELLETLRTHLANDLNRQRTARDLHLHANTVDYRLKRIRQLTGCDPANPNGQWYLQSALIAHTYTNQTRRPTTTRTAPSSQRPRR